MSHDIERLAEVKEDHDDKLVGKKHGGDDADKALLMSLHPSNYTVTATDLLILSDTILSIFVTVLFSNLCDS